MMRTTLTLDTDVAERLKALMAERDWSLKEAVNETMRLGLDRAGATPQKPFRVIPHDLGFHPGIDQFKLQQVVDELEVEDFWRKQGRQQRQPARRKTPARKVR